MPRRIKKSHLINISRNSRYLRPALISFPGAVRALLHSYCEWNGSEPEYQIEIFVIFGSRGGTPFFEKPSRVWKEKMH